MSTRTRRESLNGRVFNSVEIIKDAPDFPYKLKSGKIKRFRQVHCKCLLCGNEFKKPVLLSNIRSGNTKSCGCQESSRKKKSAKPIQLGRLSGSYLEIVKEIELIYLPSGRAVRQIEAKCHGPCQKPDLIIKRNWESVRNLLTTSCGCHQRQRAAESNLRDYTGETSGHLEAIKRLDRSVGDGNAIWLCKCSCGRHKKQNMRKWGRAMSCGECGLKGGRDSYRYFTENQDWAESTCTLYIVEVNHGECFKIGIAKNYQSRASVSKCFGVEYTDLILKIELRRTTAWAVEQFILALTFTKPDAELTRKYKGVAGRYELRSSAQMVAQAARNADNYINECEKVTWQSYYREKLDSDLKLTNIENVASFFQVRETSYKDARTTEDLHGDRLSDEHLQPS